MKYYTCTQKYIENSAKDKLNKYKSNVWHTVHNHKKIDKLLFIQQFKALLPFEAVARPFFLERFSLPIRFLSKMSLVALRGVGDWGRKSIFIYCFF